MLNRKTVAAIVLVQFLAIALSFGAGIEDNWNDFLHYVKIGRFDLAKGYAQAILDSNPDPVKLKDLARQNHYGYQILRRVVEDATDQELVDISKKVINLVEEGLFIARSNDVIVAEAVRELSVSERGKYIATKRLANAGEYAIPFMLDAMADPARKNEFVNVVEALPKVGRDAIRPLAACLQMDNLPIKAEVVKALGEIGYTHSLGHLKYIVETAQSQELRSLAAESIRKIDPEAAKLPAAVLFYKTAEQYYYHTESLKPAEDADFGNVWFWDAENKRLAREPVARDYFYELMAMRNCEWALKADEGFGQAIGLWVASFFKAEAAGVGQMPAYFGDAHATALVYATTAGPEYLHQALARAVRDKNADVALGVVEALAVTAGEKSLLQRLGVAQPLVDALSFDDKAVRYSAAIALGLGGPTVAFPESKLVAVNLAEALGQKAADVTEPTRRWTGPLADSYALRAAETMLALAVSRNKVVNLSLAQPALIAATNDSRDPIKKLSGQVLAYLNSPDAQRAIAAMALLARNDMAIRVAAFESLGTSAKINGNMLVEQMVDDIYALIGDGSAPAELRAAAAAAYGSLNLPSRKVKDLILDQARS